MILLSLSELSVDTMVSDLQSTPSGRVLKYLHTLKKRFVADGSSSSSVDDVTELRFVETFLEL